MRIISGSLKGRKIMAPGNLPVRPTTDVSKEALFNILDNTYELEGLRVLDVFSGTGNISLEFISRGVVEVISIDANYNCISFQKKIIKELNVTNLHSYKIDAFKGIEKVKGTFDIIFADPPYDFPKTNLLPDFILSKNLLNENGVLIIEHGRDTIFNTIKPIETRSYGKVNFSFFKVLSNEFHAK
jgi:16S rRNA (guanine966-N2)-methyltransferase